MYQSRRRARGVDVEAASTRSIRGADQDSFERFYESEIDRQVRRAILLLGSNDVANDVVHDSFIEVFRRWDNIDEPGAYLQRTVLNRCRGIHRNRSRFRSNAFRLWAVRDDTTQHEDPLDDVLATLPFNHRAALILKFYFGLTTAEIADELGCPAGSVGPWIQRGLDKMRKALQ